MNNVKRLTDAGSASRIYAVDLAAPVCSVVNRDKDLIASTDALQIPSEASEEPSDTVIHFDFDFFFIHRRALLSANQRQ